MKSVDRIFEVTKAALYSVVGAARDAKIIIDTALTKFLGKAVPADQQISDVDILSTVLTGAWRRAPLALSPNLSQADMSRTSLPFAYSGTATLAWNRVKRSHLRQTPQAELFKVASRELALTQLLQEEALGDPIGLVPATGSFPLLFKGWAAAQFFAIRELRPFGDVDICVPTAAFPKVATLLKKHANSVSEVGPDGVTFHIRKGPTYFTDD